MRGRLRGGDHLAGFGRDRQRAQVIRDRGRRPGGVVGDERKSHPGLARLRQRLRCTRNRVAADVDDPVEVEQRHVVARRERPPARGQGHPHELDPATGTRRCCGVLDTIGPRDRHLARHPTRPATRTVPRVAPRGRRSAPGPPALPALRRDRRRGARRAARCRTGQRRGRDPARVDAGLRRLPGGRRPPAGLGRQRSPAGGRPPRALRLRDAGRPRGGHPRAGRRGRAARSRRRRDPAAREHHGRPGRRPAWR